MGILGNLMAGAAGGASVSIIIKAVDNFSKTFKSAEMQTKGLGSTVMSAMGGPTGVALAAGAAATRRFHPEITCLDVPRERSPAARPLRR